MDDRTKDPSQFDTFRLANKYRRAFRWRVSKGDAEDQSEVVGSVYLANSDYPDILEDYLSISRRRHNNKTAMSKLQIQMLNDISVQELSIKHYKEKLSQDGVPQGFIKSQISAHGMIANAIRQIGDANAVKQTVLADGTVAELEEWASINDQEDRRAIFNAVTNCISIGDITAVDANGSVELIEVKSGKTKSRRLIRQKNRLKDAAGILTTGSGMVQGRSIIAASAPIVPRNYLPGLKIMLEEAGKSGWSSGLVAPHCYVECVDVGKLAELQQTAPAMEPAYKLHTKEWGPDLASKGCSLDIITFACIELMIGAKFFTSYINSTEVLRLFTAAGWSIESALEEAVTKTNGEAVVIMNKAGFHCHIPPADFAKLQFELLAPATLLDECEFLRASGPKSSAVYGVWTYDGEATQWN
jgi:hypothetical protein